MVGEPILTGSSTSGGSPGDTRFNVPSVRSSVRSVMVFQRAIDAFGAEASLYAMGGDMGLRAVVIGTGWAAEGHVRALQSAGVEVVAVCGRTPERAQALASQFGIESVRLDWHGALTELKPDIVAIATPGGAHREMVEAAAQERCHIFCDKPMGVNAADARAMVAAVRRAGVKHAYGATSCLEPVFVKMRGLLADDTIGTLTGIEVQTHMGLSPLLPYSWFHQLDQGGGMLNQIFTHVLAQVLYVTQGRPKDVVGEAKCRIAKAPVGQAIHDFRQWFSPVTDITSETLWHNADADTEYSVMMRLLLPRQEPITVRVYGSLNSQDANGGQFAVYGTEGTLIVTGGGNAKGIQHKPRNDTNWRKVEVPPSVEHGWAASQSNEQNNWNVVLGRFAADVRAERSSFYPTFEDGCEASEIIDLIRAGAGWSPIPKRSN
jgi:predicted dehydrogenase